MQDTGTGEAIAALGNALGPDVLQRVHSLYAEEQWAIARAVPPPVADLAYGPYQRQKLDLYRTSDEAAAPILVWVHGGGFLRGEKASPDHPFNAQVGRWAARNGFLGAVINYRLAPENQWPSGADDVASSVDWLCANAADHGGDPERIILAGTSAGAVHIASHLARGPVATAVRGAILLSGLYGFTPLEERDTLYYGDAALYPRRMPRDALIATDLPLFFVCAQFDPPRFQAEFLGILQARLERHGAMPRGQIASGHNHYSLAYHLGGSDTRLSDEMIAFARDPFQHFERDP